MDEQAQPSRIVVASWCVTGAQINSALYLGTIAYAAIFYHFRAVLLWALLAMGLAYCSYLAQLWAFAIGTLPGKLIVAASIVVGIWAGIDLMLRL